MGTFAGMVVIIAIIADIMAIGSGFKNSTADVFGVLFTGVSVLAIALANMGAKTHANELAVQVDAEREKRERFFSAPLNAIACSLNLNSGECCYWGGPADEVMNVKHSQRLGYYGGPSVRVARGLYVRAGTSRSHTVANVAPEVVDRGTLYLTNSRIVFTGGDGSKVFTYKQILHIDTFTDGFSIDTANSKRVTFITHEPFASWSLQRIAKGDYNPRPEPALQ